MRIFGFCDRKDVILWTILNALTAKEFTGSASVCIAIWTFIILVGDRDTWEFLFKFSYFETESQM